LTCIAYFDKFILEEGGFLDDLISLNEAAKIVGVDRSAFYRWNKSGRITLYKKGSRTVIKRSDAERIKAENEDVKPLSQK